MVYAGYLLLIIIGGLVMLDSLSMQHDKKSKQVFFMGMFTMCYGIVGMVHEALSI